MKRAALISCLAFAVAGLTSLAAQAPRSTPQGAKPATARPASTPPAARTIDVTVREGTSMSVALSPNGRTIATDMQGSIWTMPAAGGAMTRVTDVFNDARQPMWSRDGGTITFFAYRDGGYDIWSINADGTNQGNDVGPFDDRGDLVARRHARGVLGPPAKRSQRLKI